MLARLSMSLNTKFDIFKHHMLHAMMMSTPVPMLVAGLHPATTARLKSKASLLAMRSVLHEAYAARVHYITKDTIATDLAIALCSVKQDCTATRLQFQPVYHCTVLCTQDFGQQKPAARVQFKPRKVRNAQSSSLQTTHECPVLDLVNVGFST